MNMDEWEHVDLWHKRGPHFLVEVKRLIDDNDNCWWVYAYIYHDHPYFAHLSTEVGDASRTFAASMPLHGGPTLLCRYYDDHGVCVSVQVGGDYMHLDDDCFLRADDASAAAGVFLDAEKLFEWLSDCPLTTGDPSHD